MKKVEEIWWKDGTLYLQFEDGSVYAYKGAYIKDVSFDYGEDPNVEKVGLNITVSDDTKEEDENKKQAMACACAKLLGNIK